MRISYLREFIELGNCLSFSKAAEKFFISQPALSNHMNELEKYIGAELIDRTRPIRLTRVGKKFFEESCQIVDVFDALIADCHALSSFSEKESLTFRAPCGGSTFKGWLFRLISNFREAYEGIDMRVITSVNDYLVDEIASGAVDCGGFIWLLDEDYLQETFPEIDFLQCGTSSIGLWVRSDHPLAQLKTLRIEDVEGYPYLIPKGAGFDELVQSAKRLFMHYGVSPNYRFATFESYDEYLFALKKDDILLGFPMGNYDVSGALDDRIFIPFTPSITCHIYLGIKKQTPKTAASKFFEFAKSNLAESPIEIK